ncbi:MAG: peptidase M14 family protein [Candidatus Bathyarchaeota archaeon]|nr:MAG: peptidase M14 family protein [Candidatus Bathyarchaeota archaeon]
MASKKIISPEDHFGFRLGADRKLARWDKIVEYFYKLEKASDRIKLAELGKTTMGHPFILAYISSPENLSELEKYREMSWRIGHPEGLTEDGVEEIVEEGKAVVAMTMSIHASEVGGTQLSSELAHELITSEDSLAQSIRENVIFLLFPSANPDGNIMVVNHYNKYLGTEYEGTSLPWLYHQYVGHDNNRDALTLTQVETQMVSRVILKEWFPQAYIDHHQMGSTGARFFIPPNADPLNEVVDPMVWIEQRHYGSQMLWRMESAGISGVASASDYPADFMPGWSLVFPWFGICGMFTESASAKLATPTFVHYHQLGPGSRGRPEYRTSTNFQHPWKGGWWHLRDIMDGQRVSSFALLEVAANHRKDILRNMYSKSRRAAKRGTSEAPYAYIMPADQHDPLTALKLLRTMHDLGVEAHRANSPVKVGGVNYPAGSHVILLSQTARSFLISLLGQTFYRDSVWVRNRDGTPMMNYDFATMTMAEFKGVSVLEAEERPEGELVRLDAIELPEGGVEGSGKKGYLLDPRLNDSFKAVNMLLKEKVKVHRVKEGVESLPAGSFYVPAGRGVANKVEEVATAAHVTFTTVDSDDFETEQLGSLRIAMYQRFYGGNMDEGWNRWLMEQYGFDYTTVKDDDVKAGLAGKYDVLILPSDASELIIGEKIEEYYEKRFKGRRSPPKYPPEYRSGIGEDGVEKIKEFVQAGGTLLTLNAATEFAIDKLKVPVINVVKDAKPDEFHSPGSTLHVDIDNSHRLAYGMPEKGLIVLRGKIAFAVKPEINNEDYGVVVSYPEERLMRSGWLIGEEKLARKAAMIEAKMGEGRVVLYGFSPQARALTDGTFKLFFNALLG